MTVGVTGHSVVMEMKRTVSQMAQILSAPANQASRRQDTTPVEVHMQKTLYLLWQITTHFRYLNYGKCLHCAGRELSCNIFLYNIIGLHFSDKNECLQFGVCSHVCNNTKGSYKCSCHKYFTRINDTCKADSEDQNFICFIWSFSF